MNKYQNFKQHYLIGISSSLLSASNGSDLTATTGATVLLSFFFNALPLLRPLEVTIEGGLASSSVSASSSLTMRRFTPPVDEEVVRPLGPGLASSESSRELVETCLPLLLLLLVPTVGFSSMVSVSSSSRIRRRAVPAVSTEFDCTANCK